MIIECLEQVTFTHKIRCGKVTDHFRTPRHIDTGIIRHRTFFEEDVFPIRIRIAIPLFLIGRMTILVDNSHGIIVSPSGWIQTSFTFYRVIHQIESIIGIIFFRKFGCYLRRDISLYLHASFTFLTTLGSNKNNTISPLHTIHCCSGSILQHGNTLYRRDINRTHLTLNAIYQHQRFAIVP